MELLCLGTESFRLQLFPAFSGGEEAALYHHLYEANAPLAMGYVPFQHWEQLIERARALQYGTVFHELISRFAGKEGAEYEPEFLWRIRIRRCTMYVIAGFLIRQWEDLCRRAGAGWRNVVKPTGTENCHGK